MLLKRVAQKVPGHPIKSWRAGKGLITSLIVPFTEKGVIGDTSHAPSNPDPENHNNSLHHNPGNPHPTPEAHNNHRGMSNNHKDSGNKLVEALQLQEER